MVLAILILAYLSVTIYTHRKISKTILLSRKQRIANSILNALIPCLWYYLISPIIFPKDKTITRDEREKLSGNNSADTMLPTIHSDGNAV